MKKILSIIALLLITTPARADSITSGVGLLLPTTGIIDTTRSWADKYNSNFTIIGSSLNTANSNISTLFTATSALALTANNTNYIQNGSALQTSATFYVASGTVGTQLYVGSFTSYGTMNTTSTITGGAFNTAGVSTFAINVVQSSETVYGTVTSSTGFVGGPSTFTQLTINTVALNFPATGGANNQVLTNNGSNVLSWQNQASAVSTTSMIYNLVITSIGVLTSSLQITCDKVDVMGNIFINVSTQVNLSITGIGGLNTGSVANSTWYELDFVTNGTTIGVIASSGNSLNPTMPTGFTKWRRIGHVFVDSSGNIVPFIKQGLSNPCIYWNPRQIVNGANMNNFQLVDVSTNLPPGVSDVMIHGNTTGSGNTDGRIWLFVDGSIQNTNSIQNEYNGVDTGGTSPTRDAQIHLGMLGTRKVWWRTGTGTGTIQMHIVHYTEGDL